MRTYSVKFEGRWPVGAVLVVTARTRIRARDLAEKKLKEIGLPQIIDKEQLELIDTENENVVVLVDGNY